MALDAGTLEIKVVANAEGATKEIQGLTSSVEGVTEANTELEESGSKTTGTLSDLFGSLKEKVSGSSGLGGALTSVLGSLTSVGGVGGAAIAAIGAAVSAAIAIINDLKEAADKAAGVSDDLITKSAKTGYTTTQLQAMDYAGRFVDVSTDTMISAEKKMVSYMQNAADGGESAIAAFDKLGVSVTNTDGSLRDSKEVMGEVVAALGQIDDYTTRLAAAQDVFGLNNAAEMMPLVNAGWQTYLDLQKEAIDNGLILTLQEIERLGARDDMNQKIEATKEATELHKGAAYTKETDDIDLKAELAKAQAKNEVARAAATAGDAEKAIEKVRQQVTGSWENVEEQAKAFNQILVDGINSGQITQQQAMDIAAGYKSVGSNVADGTAEGFLSSWPATAQQILASNQALYSQICALWGIASPSRKMMEVSKNIVLGMAKGMDDNSSIAVESAEHLSEDVYLHSLIGADLTGNMSMIPNLGSLKSTGNTDSHNNSINVNVNQNNSYGSGSTLMGQHNSDRKLGNMISGAIASVM